MIIVPMNVLNYCHTCDSYLGVICLGRTVLRSSTLDIWRINNLVAMISWRSIFFLLRYPVITVFLLVLFCVYAGTYAAFSDSSLSDQPVLLGVVGLLFALLHWLRRSVCLPRRPNRWPWDSVARPLRGRCACRCSWHGSLLGIVLRLLTQHWKTRP